MLRNIKYNPLKTERNAHQRLAFLLVSKGLINDFLYLSTPCKYGIIYKLLKLLEFTTVLVLHILTDRYKNKYKKGRLEINETNVDKIYYMYLQYIDS